jgi:hypothetical protein
MGDSRWVQCTPSEFAWEHAALAYLKEIIPDRAPYRAWANAEFLGQDGSVNEIDLLLITPAGITVLAAGAARPAGPGRARRTRTRSNAGQTQCAHGRSP